jgi:hypothetical protein
MYVGDTSESRTVGLFKSALDNNKLNFEIKDTKFSDDEIFCAATKLT